MDNNEIKDRIESLLTNKDLLPEALELFNKGYMPYEVIFGTSNTKSIESRIEEIIAQRKEVERLLKESNERDQLINDFLFNECTLIGYPDNIECFRTGAAVFVHNKTIVEIHEYDPRSGGCIYANHKYSSYSEKKHLKDYTDGIKRRYPSSFWERIASHLSIESDYESKVLTEFITKPKRSTL